jgi:CDP-4-dehydro-6-deoxyglucose reductase/ferredoxin-NAD(P)+ reductase (naphthalene dioxygenase ferredoxin-specific)
VSYRITVRQAGRTIEVETGETILRSALAAGIDYPYGCQSGNCGACKSRLHDGEVELSPYSEYALSDQEREQGLILACRAVPWSDCEVAWLELDETVQHPLRRLDCTVASLEQATHDITLMRLKVEFGGPYTFSAGQYASVSFAGQPPRDYSMASRPDEAELEFHVRAMEGGSVSHYVRNRLKVGDRVKVEGPMGLAYLRELHTGPILAVAGGSGLAPMKSIVETALARGMAQPIHLYFGVRAERDVYLEEHFRALAERHANLAFTVVLSEPEGAGERRTGFLHEAIAEDFDDLDGAKVYLAGPPVMVDAASGVARARGVRKEDLHADPFYSAHELEAKQVAAS